MQINELTSRIIGAAMTVHTELGPGLLESVYQNALFYQLEKEGFGVRAEVPIGITYDGRAVSDEGFRIDLLVEERVVVELKAVERTLPLHKKQLLTYLRFTGKSVGLLINFNVELLRYGIERLAMGEIE